MSETTKAAEIYITGLRNQHAVETQAIGTIQNQLPHMTEYPELHARMQADKDRPERQAATLDGILAQHDTRKSFLANPSSRKRAPAPSRRLRVSCTRRRATKC